MEYNLDVSVRGLLMAQWSSCTLLVHCDLTQWNPLVLTLEKQPVCCFIWRWPIDAVKSVHNHLADYSYTEVACLY